MTTIGYVTDVEGDWDHWQRFVSSSRVLHWHAGEAALRDGCMFVFGGDAFDRGPGDLRVGAALLSLKRRYGARVVLLMGNRDMNKLRFSSELNTDVPPAQAFSAWWDPAAPRLDEWLNTTGRVDSPLARLQWALQHTLGCPDTFEFRRRELQELLCRAHVDDETVLNSFLEAARPGGLYHQYLRAAQLAFVHGETLFVHGAADARGLRWVPALDTAFAPNTSVHGTDVEDLHQWVAALNDFAQRSIDDWELRPKWDASGRRGGDALMAYQNKMAILNRTVCVHSYVEGRNISVPGAHRDGFDARSDPYDPSVRAYLARYGVRRVVVGHMPCGEAPASLVDGAFEIVSGDTNYATPTSRAGSWAEVLLHQGRCRIHGQLANERGSYDCHIDDDVWIGTRTSDGFWVKVRLTSGEYLLSRGAGRNVESIVRRLEPIYLDFNGTTPLSPMVQEAMRAGISQLWGNAGTQGVYGDAARASILRGTQRVAQLIGATSSDQVMITSGGTESNTTALRGAVAAARAKRGPRAALHCVTTNFEHPAVDKVLSALEAEGAVSVTRVPVTPGTGQVPRDAFRAALRPNETCLVSVMHANNECGALQDLAALVAIAKEVCGPHVVVHTDASQSLGKVAVDVTALGVDLLTVCGHKFYAPKWIGALYVRSPELLALPLLAGGGQQHGMRAGTESALLVDALGVAAEEARVHLAARREHMARLRNALWTRAQILFPDAVSFTPLSPDLALPNTLSVVLDPHGPPAYELVARVAPRLLVAAGAACHRGCTTPSATLLAMGAAPELAVRALRITVGASTTDAHIEEALQCLRTAITDMKRL